MEEKKNNELNDNELESVTGGSNLTLHFYDSEDQVRFLFNAGDIIYVKENIFTKTVRCKIVRCEVFYDPQYRCYEDAYVVRGLDGSDLYTRILRDDIVNQAD